MAQGFFLRTTMWTVLMWGLLVSVRAQAHADADGDCLPGSLELSPPHIAARFGEQLELNCSATCHNHEGIYWRIGNVTTLTANIDVHPYTVSHWDVPPRCVLKLNESKEYEISLPMTVYKTPDRVSVSLQNHDGPLQEGKVFTLKCEVFNVAPVSGLTVSWLRWGEIIHNETYENRLTKTPESVSSTLDITAFRNDSNEMITCLTTLDPKHDGPSMQLNSSTKVIVHYAPEFLPNSLFRHVAEGDNVTLKCLAGGNPAPVISWDASNDALNTPEDPTTLLIDDVSTSSNYTCTATNSIGSIHQTFELNVEKTTTYTNNPTAESTTPSPMILKEASCPLQLSPPKVVVGYGESFTVNCTSTSTPTGDICWESPVGQKKCSKESALLTVDKLKQWGIKILCYSTFPERQCNVELPIMIYKTPDRVSVSLQKHDGPLQEGKVFTLKCDVFNVAPVSGLTVSWLRWGEIIHNETYENRLTETPENVSSTLDITAFRNDSNEMITCLTTLDPKHNRPSMHIKSSTQVNVHYAPEIMETYGSMNVVQGSNVSIGCSAAGNPAPEVQWTYTAAENVKEIQWNGQRHVSITETTPANGGTYVCEARNEVGSVKRSTTLTVTELDPYKRTYNFEIVVILLVVFLLLILGLLWYIYNKRKIGTYRLADNVYTAIPLASREEGTA